MNNSVSETSVAAAYPSSDRYGHSGRMGTSCRCKVWIPINTQRDYLSVVHLQLCTASYQAGTSGVSHYLYMYIKYILFTP